MQPITKDKIIAELLQEHPETEEVFLNYEMHCVRCPFRSLETIEQGAVTHGFSAETLSELVERLNEVVVCGE